MSILVQVLEQPFDMHLNGILIEISGLLLEEQQGHNEEWHDLLLAGVESHLLLSEIVSCYH